MEDFHSGLQNLYFPVLDEQQLFVLLRVEMFTAPLRVQVSGLESSVQ